ncbi:MAG: hypothetical protein GY707_00455 [Desulfobacteraceae bacterium]|nr:hypothetical protein [Desulfobacteraceae bacterium]
MSSWKSIENYQINCFKSADLVVGAVLVAGAKAPKLITKTMLSSMKKGAVPLTSTIALTNATLPYAVEIANKRWKKACKSNLELQKGINYYGNKLTYKPVAEAFGLGYTPVLDIL